jgi:hypothetical protein
LISGKLDRRRRALLLSTIASAVIHVVLLTLIFYSVARLIITQGERQRETVATTTIVTIKKASQPSPAPRRAPPHERPTRQRPSAAAVTPRQELVKETNQPAPHEPRHVRDVPSRIERDEAGYAREVAQLNAQDDPHAIPTIDPSSQESPTKSYSFDVPSSMRGDQHGNGIITPTSSWRDNGRDCYYGRYEFTYPDGAMEYGTIVWPFCFDPDSDPFKQPPHPIPFPLPPTGFKLPPDTPMPPIEKQVYQEWATSYGPGSSP